MFDQLCSSSVGENTCASYLVYKSKKSQLWNASWAEHGQIMPMLKLCKSLILKSLMHSKKYGLSTPMLPKEHGLHSPLRLVLFSVYIVFENREKHILEVQSKHDRASFF